MITFAAHAIFAVTFTILGLLNFRHQTKANAEQDKPAVVREDKDLKKRGINLPGYNQGADNGQ